MSEPLDYTRPLLAYQNKLFMESWSARGLRLLSEYVEPLDRLGRYQVRDTIVFFGSARLKEDGPLGKYYNEARELARLLTEWSDGLQPPTRRFAVCTGGGPGIMEAANRGAHDAGGITIGFNIGLPFEQHPNPYITPELSFEFHYFFMRKFWFAYLAKALVVFPGGFGTLDEMMEVLTLMQTQKLEKPMMILLYGSEYWHEIINFPALVRHGMISENDMNLFRFADDPKSALTALKLFLTANYLQPEHVRHADELPDIARSRI